MRGHPILNVMSYLARLSPVRAVQDLRFFLAQRQAYELWFLLLAIVVTTGLVAAFVHDSREERPYRRNIIYVQQWALSRTDAEIHAQQKIDGVIQTKAIADEEKRRKDLQGQYKRLDDKLKAMGI